MHFIWQSCLLTFPGLRLKKTVQSMDRKILYDAFEKIFQLQEENHNYCFSQQPGILVFNTGLLFWF